MFETDFRRMERRIQVTGSDGSRSEILADLDQGEIRAEGRMEPLAELELELAAGTSRSLFDVALTIHEAVPVRLASTRSLPWATSQRAGRPEADESPLREA